MVRFCLSGGSVQSGSYLNCVMFVIIGVVFFACMFNMARLWLIQYDKDETMRISSFISLFILLIIFIIYFGYVIPQKVCSVC